MTKAVLEAESEDEALDYVLPNALRQRLVAGDAVNHCSAFALTKAIETERGDVWSPDPRRPELRSISDSQQHPEICRLAGTATAEGGTVAVVC
jgi:hypothetical protein